MNTDQSHSQSRVSTASHRTGIFSAPTDRSENKRAVSVIGAQQNELIKALGRPDLERFFHHLEMVDMPAKKQLFGFGDTIDYTYFPGDAIVSLMHVTADGASTEIGVVGREGAVGVSWYAGERANCSAIVQGAGFGYRVKASALRELINDGGPLALLLMRYTSALFVQVAQKVVGAVHCNLEQQYCRWMLDRLDRSHSNELKVTHELIAEMLGVRRESITAIACKLADQGIIFYRRGKVEVLDREALESSAGNCYRETKTCLAQL